MDYLSNTAIVIHPTYEEIHLYVVNWNIWNMFLEVKKIVIY